VCPSCSDLYARDTWQLVHAGLHGGHHNVPTTVAQHPQVFVTLTAPSFGAVHTTRADGSCHSSDGDGRRCEHRRPLCCRSAHDKGDSELGQPLCGECYDYVGHVLFSWHAPELWRRFTIRLRRLLSREQRQRGENPKNTRVSFMKVAELQRRGLIHYHAVVRLDAATDLGEPPAPPDTSISASDLRELVRQAVADVEITVREGRVLRFGEQFDVQSIGCSDPLEPGGDQVSGRLVAGYLAKYVTKSVSDFGVGVRRLAPEAISQLDVSEHVRAILTVIVVLAEHEAYREMLSWLHTLAYRGHVTTKSRRFSTTMTALRERRAQWRKEQAFGETEHVVKQLESSIPSRWVFARSGLTTAGDRVLVLSAFARAREHRLTARDALKEGTQNDEAA
jgi:hypothetical protein